MSDPHFNSTSAAASGHDPQPLPEVVGGAMPPRAEEQPVPVDSVADPAQTFDLEAPVSPPPPPTGVPPEGSAIDGFVKEGEVRVRPSNVKIYDLVQELDASLPALTKMHLLKGGIEERSLPATRDELQAAEKFFEANHAWTARHLIDLMARSQALGPTTGIWEHPWLSKKGVRLSYLLTNLKRILAQMKVQEQYPAVVLVEPLVLFPRHGKPPRRRKAKE